MKKLTLDHFTFHFCNFYLSLFYCLSIHDQVIFFQSNYYFEISQSILNPYKSYTKYKIFIRFIHNYIFTLHYLLSKISLIILSHQTFQKLSNRTLNIESHSQFIKRSFQSIFNLFTQKSSVKKESWVFMIDHWWSGLIL